MLVKTPYTSPTLTPSIRVISGQTIAKSDWDPRQRADYAARWKLGLVQVDPSTKMAAMVFGVSVPLVAEAITGITKNGFAPIPSIDLVWGGMSASERDDFVARHLLQVWDAIERVTA